MSETAEHSDRHLNGPEFELLIATSGEGDVEWRKLKAHLDGCRECRQRMDLYRSQGLERLAPAVAAARGPDCPPTGVWMEVAGATMDRDVAERMSAHAASCDHCGPRLADAMAILHGEDIPIEAGAAMSADFRKSVVDRLAPRQRRVPPAVWIGAMAASLVLAVVVWQRSRPDPDRLIADAYSARRVVEVRLPGAAHSPVRVVKGMGESPDPGLAEAELLVARGLAQDPDSAHWLQLRSRMDLLRGQYDRAVSTLDRISARGGPALAIDLGNALLLRGTAQGAATDLHRAVEEFSKAAKEPTELGRVALFNRAIALERLYLWDAAAADWKRYIELDPNGGWAGEATSRLRDIEQRKRTWRQRLDQFDGSPAGFLAAVQQDPAPPLERYLDSAMSTWLADPGEPAVKLLAELLVRRHGDRWLADMLAERSSPEALAALSLAVRANSMSDHQAALAAAIRAEGLFAHDGPGWLRSRVERVYALSRTYRSDECSTLARAVARRMEDRHYRWASGQLRLEMSTCAVRADYGQARLLVDQAVAGVREAGYPILLLRALGLQSNVVMASGRLDEGNRLDRDGLALYWSGSHPPERAYQFYNNMSLSSEKRGFSEVGFFASDEAVPFIGGRPSTQAMARYRVALFAAATGRSDRAESEARQAEAALDSLGDRLGIPERRAENQLLLAGTHLGGGKPDLTRSVLDRVRVADLGGVSALRVTHNRLKGTLALREGKPAEAREHFAAALLDSDQALAKLASDTDRAHWKRAAAPLYRQLVGMALDHDRDPEFGLALWERFRSAPVRGAPDRADASARQARQLAASYRGSTVLAFAEIDDALVGWLFDDRAIRWFRAARSASATAELCSQFQRAAARRETAIDDLRAKGRLLYDILVRPVESHLDSNRILLVEPDGACSGIPFEALVAGDGSFVADRIAVATSPGAHAELALRASAPPVDRGMRALVVESPRLGSAMLGLYPPLPQSKREADLVAALFPNHVRLSADRANAESALAELPSASVFYFGGHGTSHGDAGGLVLAGTGGRGADILDGARLEGAARRCSVAILSACSTAAGERMGPFRPDSLVQSLWRAGVPTVVATRWEVEERASVAVMRPLLEGLLEGKPAAVALRGAVAALRRDPSLDHPAAWAAFHVFGIGGKETHHGG